jgi:hypothetical protein
VSKGPKGKHRKKKVALLPKPQPLTLPKAVTGGSKRMTLFLTIIGLLLTALGSITVIELFPRLSASTAPSLDGPNYMESFVISNDGYLSVQHVEVDCFIWNATVATNSLSFIGGRGMIPPAGSISPNDAYTVSCNRFLDAPSSSIESIDLGIIVHYRPWPFTFIRRRRIFRFVGKQQRQGGLNWFRQPSEPIEEAFDQWLPKNMQ